MKINKDLNLVFPVDIENGVAHVHSSLVSLVIFHAHWRPMNQAFAAIYADGLMGGPRIAYHALKDAAKSLGDTDFEKVFWPEVIRLANVWAPVEGEGYRLYPLETIIKNGLLDEEQIDEIYNAIAFFTVASRMHTAKTRREHLSILEDLWGARVESLSVMELKDSLPTSKPDEPIGEKEILSAIPS